MIVSDSAGYSTDICLREKDTHPNKSFAPHGIPGALMVQVPNYHILSQLIPKGPCTQIAYTLAPKHLYRDYFKAKVYTVWVHGPLGYYA